MLYKLIHYTSPPLTTDPKNVITGLRIFTASEWQHYFKKALLSKFPLTHTTDTGRSYTFSSLAELYDAYNVIDLDVSTYNDLTKIFQDGITFGDFFYVDPVKPTSAKNYTHKLVKFSDCYGDEFDVEGHSVFSMQEWNTYLEGLRKVKYPCIRYFGTNEFLEYDDYHALRSMYDAIDITEEEYQCLNRLNFLKSGTFIHITPDSL